MLKKLATGFMLCFMCISLCACSIEDDTQAKKDEFSQYHTGNDVALIIDFDVIFFNTHTLRLEEVMVGVGTHKGLILTQDKISFFKQYKDSSSAYAFTIYQCDFYGNNLTAVFEKTGLDQSASAIVNGNTFYIEYVPKSDSVKRIDSFNVLTGEYKNVASGEACDLSEYAPLEPIYSWEICETDEETYFEITNLETQEKKVVDDVFLSKTIYAESLNKFPHGPRRVDFSNGHILLTYMSFAGWWDYAYLIFDYDFETETLEYKALVFPYDTVPIDIVYID